MASLISIASRTQQSYSSLENKNDAIHSHVEDWEIDIDYPIIAKGNVIEGIEAEE